MVVVHGIFDLVAHFHVAFGCLLVAVVAPGVSMGAALLWNWQRGLCAALYSGEVMLYRVFRNTHLLFGVFCCLFLLMYGISAVQMAHNKWFDLRPDVTTLQVTLPAKQADARVVARELMDGSGLRGDLSGIHAAPQNLTFNIVRPGTVDQVTYSLPTGETTVRENRAGVMGMMNRLHHAAGFAGAYWWDSAWGIFIAIVSVGLFVIGLTGVYLWFKIHTERLIGVILLVLSLGYSLTLLVLIRAAG